MSDRMVDAMTKRIDKRLNELRDQATSGILGRDEYAKIVGLVEGLRVARAIVEDEKRNFFHRDDLE